MQSKKEKSSWHHLFKILPLQQCFSERRGWKGVMYFNSLSASSSCWLCLVRHQKVLGQGMFSGWMNMVIWTQMWLLNFSKSASCINHVAQVCCQFESSSEQAGSFCFFLRTMYVSCLSTSSCQSRGRTSFLPFSLCSCCCCSSQHSLFLGPSTVP